MGQVYQATDTKLNRQVALKILPEAFATDPDRLARFQREAQVLASLNHPNIAAIHGLEESEGTRALVLELVEGPTLADRIAKGPIPLDEALPIAKQIAEALEAAHEAGVIHRDLKPANIKVKDDGTVKVLDFGLAKALDTTPEGDPSQSPTLTAAATQMGVILGTAAYMSPEQARGKPVDKRADIWAFGAVLFEMLTGRRAFAGEDVSLTLSAVLQREPEWEALAPAVPSGLNTYLRRCLHKDPTQRIQAVGDVRLAMEGAFETTERADIGPTAPAPLQVWQRPIPAAIAALTIAAVASLGVWGLLRAQLPPSRPPARFTITPPPTKTLNIAIDSVDVAISPDGQRVAYLTGVGTDIFGPKQLLLRSLGDFTPTILAEQAPMYHPFFSPDSDWVGFYDVREQELQRVSVTGGSAIPIGALDSSMRGASWGADDTIVFATQEGDLWPQILPGDQAVLYSAVAASVDDSEVVVLSLETGERTVVVRGGFYGRYVPTGHLVYAVGDALRAVPFDLDRLETVGGPVSIVDGVVTKRRGGADFSVSENGSLVYVSGTTPVGDARTLVWVDREGREEEIPAPTAPYESPRVSPDGRYIAMEVRDPENADVMVFDLQRETSTRLARAFTTSTRRPPMVPETSNGSRRATRSSLSSRCRPTGSPWWSSTLVLARKRILPPSRWVPSLRPKDSSTRSSTKLMVKCLLTAVGWPMRPTNQECSRCTSGRSRMWTTVDGRFPAMVVGRPSGQPMGKSSSFGGVVT